MPHTSRSQKLQKGIVNDQFFTKPEVAAELSEIVKAQPWFQEVKAVVEPAAGNGAFSNLFPDCLAFDIDPKHENIVESDFLTTEIYFNSATLSIGNPPFGRQGSLALKFIKKCCGFSKYVAFILPLSFKKVSVQNRVPLSHSLIYEQELKPDSFCLADGTPHDVPCVFQIWHEQPREKVVLLTECEYFDWTDKEHGDLAIRRVGFYAGRVAEDYQSTCEESHYYIKCRLEIDHTKTAFNQIDWAAHSQYVVGARSLSKAEIICGFNAFASCPFW